MPSAANSRARVLLAMLSLVATATGLAQPAPAPVPTRAEVEAAMEKVRADPNLGTTLQKRVLRWNNPASAKMAPHSEGWFKWVGNAFEWLASTARILVWVIGIVLAGVLVLVIKRIVESRGVRSRPLAFSMPTHVQDLDIRPESLPDDVGAAALDLWQRGEHRAALSLLYRGLLSRLAHAHGVPIRDSSTEGDCLVLASRHLSEPRAAYASQLIRVWQRAVYGNLDPTLEEFRALASGFAAALDPPPEALVEQAA